MGHAVRTYALGYDLSARAYLRQRGLCDLSLLDFGANGACYSFWKRRAAAYVFSTEVCTQGRTHVSLFWVSPNQARAWGTSLLIFETRVVHPHLHWCSRCNYMNCFF